MLSFACAIMRDMDLLLLDSLSYKSVRDGLPGDAALASLADFFSVLADRTRMKILVTLSYGKMCVTDISAVTGVNQTTVSHQLKTLRGANIISCERQGKISFYYISDKRVIDILGGATDVICG